MQGSASAVWWDTLHHPDGTCHREDTYVRIQDLPFQIVGWSFPKTFSLLFLKRFSNPHTWQRQSNKHVLAACFLYGFISTPEWDQGAGISFSECLKTTGSTVIQGQYQPNSQLCYFHLHVQLLNSYNQMNKMLNTRVFYFFKLINMSNWASIFNYLDFLY